MFRLRCRITQKLDMFDRFFELALACVLSAVVVITGWLFVDMWKDSRAPSFTLKKAEWTCTRNEENTRRQPVVAGNVTTLIHVTDVVCVEYRRNKD